MPEVIIAKYVLTAERVNADNIIHAWTLPIKIDESYEEIISAKKEMIKEFTETFPRGEYYLSDDIVSYSSDKTGVEQYLDIAEPMPDNDFLTLLRLEEEFRNNS